MNSSKVIFVLVSLVGLVQAQIEAPGTNNVDVSLVCDRTGNPCMEDTNDPRFAIISLMIESALELREYEIENGISTSVHPDLEWTYTDKGWHKNKIEGEGKGGTKSRRHSSSRRGVRGLVGENNLRGREGLEEFDPKDVQRELGANACDAVCVNSPQDFVCSFMCKKKGRRLAAEGISVCTEEIHLREFMEDFPTNSIDECVASVFCTLTMPCTA